MAECYVDGAVSDWQNAGRTCHVFLKMVCGVPTFAFEGTIDFAEWMEDLNLLLELDTVPIGPVHADSLNNVLGVLPAITGYIDSLGKPPIRLIGHSKGAREAPIAQAHLKAMGYSVLSGVYFEAPRVGGPKLRAYLADQFVIQTQTWNSSGPDIVTLVPDFLELWEDVVVPMRLRVPDNLGIRPKHIMSGVARGLAPLLIP